MKREKYHYNPSTLQYEKVKVTLKSKLIYGFGILCGIIVAGLAFYYVIDNLVQSPQERILTKKLDEMEFHVGNLASDYNVLMKDVDALQEKDANIHRVILGVEPIDENIWEGGTGGSERYSFLGNNFNANKLLKEYLSKAEKLKHKVALQKRSLDTLESLAKEREDRLVSIPSIKPVSEDKLKRNVHSLSGFGIRIHPVHGVKKFHKGIDFTAPSGTKIIASGNGKVTRVENKKTGYGKNVIVDHGYGYQTLYAHMSKVEVKVGDVLLKGQTIGEVGSTGTSTAPHLHYEVRLNGKAINPLDYCLDGLSPSEYRELVNKASMMNQSFD